ncbi:MAG: hypothetical protein QG593_273 [Patescibacteria group bacterium]|nr:hypothetical protein [Patescibacteria group bacterium]
MQYLQIRCMLLSMSKNEIMSTDYTSIIQTLGTKSEITIYTSTSDDGITTSYHLIKRSTPNTFGVLAVNELPAAGPALTFTTKDNEGEVRYETGGRLFCKPLDVDSANFSLWVLRQLTITRHRK